MLSCSVQLTERYYCANSYQIKSRVMILELRQHLKTAVNDTTCTPLSTLLLHTDAPWLLSVWCQHKVLLCRCAE